ncbi:acetolactate synthase small subunit [Dictyobacter alpinus]|uniref:Acetolactate synthase small subunit n=1 Tax=Dictyobacter alpinus TaxID=2014873 RepID=A0A402B9C1_9CHLR|nr:acetolactate synthase small subunit [Dictyobacter alpinus]GCE27964.1 acetolactate synthase small subunit [Dictyobacter alpinus]
MTNNTATTVRAHHSNAQQGTEKTHTLIITVVDRPGAVDRVVGVLRRRRSMLQSFSLAPDTQTDIFRVTAQVKDAEVVVDHLVAQIRKIIDVQEVTNVTSTQAIQRELVLIQVATANVNTDELIAIGLKAGAAVVDTTPAAMTFEATGSPEEINLILTAFQAYTLHDVVRSGCVAMARMATEK